MRGRIGIVARREFITTVRRPSYLVATLGMPLFAALFLAIPLLIGALMASKESAPRLIGIHDPAGRLGLTEETEFRLSSAADIDEIVARELAGHKDLAEAGGATGGTRTLRLRPFASAEAGQAAVSSGEIASLVAFGEDWLATGRVEVYTKEGLLASGRSLGHEPLRRFVIERLLVGRVEPDILERIRRPLAISTFTLGRDGAWHPQDIVREIGVFAVPFGFMMLFFLSVMMSSGYLLQGVSEEKESRVIEVILSSIRAEDLLAGKLIGLGAAGVLQVLVWTAFLTVPMAALLPTLRVRPAAVLLSIAFYGLGYLLYGVLLTGSGSLGQNLKESQQYGLVWSLASIVPMFCLMPILAEPNGVLARVLSLVPLTAATTMFLRLHAAEGPPWWEIALSAALLAASVRVAHTLMARLFRVGLLLYGKSPTIPEILRLLRTPRA